MAKKLLDQLRETLRLKHSSYRTEPSCVDWVRRFITFGGGLAVRSPLDMGREER